MAQINKLKKLKKGKKIKVNEENYLVEDFADDIFHDDETGEDAQSKEIILSKQDNYSKKLLSQKYAVIYNQDKKSIQLAKVSEKRELFKNGFEYKKNVVIVNYGGDYSNEERLGDEDDE